jgi:hypothetical protein
VEPLCWHLRHWHMVGALYLVRLVLTTLVHAFVIYTFLRLTTPAHASSTVA